MDFYLSTVAFLLSNLNLDSVIKILECLPNDLQPEVNCSDCMNLVTCRDYAIQLYFGGLVSDQ